MKKILSLILITALLTVSLAFSAFAADNDDYSVLGKLKEHGYVNEYFDFQIELPHDFTLASRALLDLNDEDVVEASNKEDTLSWLSSMLKLSSATVFEADNGSNFITISVESPGILKDSWDEEKVVAENSVQNVLDSLDELNSEDLAISDIETKVDYLDDFAGDKHYVIMYVYAANDIPIFGANIFVRSDDEKYMAVINIETFDPDNVETICSLFTEIR